jgi:hypothetical protein
MWRRRRPPLLAQLGRQLDRLDAPVDGGVHVAVEHAQLSAELVRVRQREARGEVLEHGDGLGERRLGGGVVAQREGRPRQLR